MDKNEIEKQIKELFTAIGACVEMWNVAYKNFKSAGYSEEEAMKHTEAFVRVLLTTKMGGQG